MKGVPSALEASMVLQAPRVMAECWNQADVTWKVLAGKIARTVVGIKREERPERPG